MRKYFVVSALCGAAALLFVLTPGCGQKVEEPVVIEPARLVMFKAISAPSPVAAGSVEDRRIALGRMLYYEPRLSRSQQISCNSCHRLDRYGVDNEPTSPGHNGQRGERNSPTVYNAATHVAQFWDGRAADLEEQAKGPVLNPVEMAMPSGENVVATLKTIPAYPALFREAYPEEQEPLTYDNVAKSIAAFEARLVTPAPWDHFLQGDQAAIGDDAKSGFLAFTQTGCQTCHAGALLGGNLFQKLGNVEPYPDQSDPGRFQVTKNEADRMVFKVPTLRNIEKTAPYYHNGKVATLDEAIRTMAKHQLGQDLSDEHVALIARWMESLTGEIPADYVREPTLPKASASTPKPELGE